MARPDRSERALLIDPDLYGLRQGVVPGQGYVTRVSATTVRVAAGKGWVAQPSGLLRAVKWAQTDITVPGGVANGRVDQVIVGASGVPSLLQGANAGAAIANLDDANAGGSRAAVPAGSMRLWEFVTDNTGAVQASRKWRDMRGWARGKMTWDFTSGALGQLGFTDGTGGLPGLWIGGLNGVTDRSYRLSGSGFIGTPGGDRVLRMRVNAGAFNENRMLQGGQNQSTVIQPVMANDDGGDIGISVARINGGLQGNVSFIGNLQGNRAAYSDRGSNLDYIGVAGHSPDAVDASHWQRIHAGDHQAEPNPVSSLQFFMDTGGYFGGSLAIEALGA